MVTLPIPENVILEVGGLETLPDGRLAVVTRRGEVWLVENPEGSNGHRPHFTRFAQGLHEALGLAWHDGALYTAQRSELTRLRDTDGDGRANRYETVYAWPLSGNYHEYSFGPVFSPKGDMIVTLNLAWVGYGDSFVKWRGWMLRITPDGNMTPVAAGFRSPSSFGYNLDGDLFYSENQGDWVGSGSITHVESGDFVGNPTSLRWSSEPGSPVKLTRSDIPDSGEPKFEVAKRVPGLKPPAVWFPHAVLGISTSAILVDSTRGGFGPFAGQLFVGDQGQSKIMRVFLEKVNGVYQGVVFPFREGFASGVLRQTWGRDGSMYVGQTSRGWSATGTAPFGLQRLVWTGMVPFEAHRVEARPDGFEITFTMPIDRTVAADPGSYKVSSFTYKYHHFYGSPVINQSARPIRAVVVSPDGLRARLVLDSLRQGYIHEIMMSGVRSESGAPLLHDFGYYTVNQIPPGPRLAITPGSATRAASVRRSAVRRPVAQSNIAALAKRQTDLPDDWNGKVDQSVSAVGLDGLRFSVTSFAVKAGARVRIDFANPSDMLHNLVITRPGGMARVVDAALKLGLDGMQLHFVPPMGEVLYHTGLLEPGMSESIFFEAPMTPGDYPLVCSFPGHAAIMQGVMHVRR
jgi:azurin/glucose/arabinose dehydrogenase